MLAEMRFAPMSWLAAFLFATLAVFAGDPQRILFIGNSYTGVNKLPDVFLEVVKAYRDVPPTGDAFAPIPASDAT